ncbi:hypothetical protein HZS_7223 [Henneguya salminicola]|nr:hypothetical protein HZS_7223 [Henneguya salminicola]
MKKNYQLAPIEIYEKLILKIKQTFYRKIYSMPSKKQIPKKNNELRDKANIGDYELASSTPNSMIDGMPFYLTYWDGLANVEKNTLLVWICNESLALLQTNPLIFIDATFRSAPHPYKKLLIVIVFDAATSAYAPCAFA